MEVLEEEVAQWLQLYKSAWENRDVDLILTLFSPQPGYRERRFSEPLLGHTDLESYWRERVFKLQRDISVRCQVWGIKGNQAMVTWQATFDWLPTKSIVNMDGVAQIAFSERRGEQLVCCEFNEWMDHDNVSPHAWNSRAL